jgi:hypothetical protein
LGWGEGLALLGEPLIADILAVLEERLQALVVEVAALPAAIVLSPDNLDGQYISPRAFRAHLAQSYQLTTDALHAAGKRLLVHAGGPIRPLLALLAAAGVDGVEGVSGPPQGNATLAEARALAGPGLALWGGIPQDYLLPAHDDAAFEAAVRATAREALGDPRIILGVADRVPVAADISRIAAIPELIAQER